MAPTFAPNRPAGPIKTLKRTFSSGGTVLTAGVTASTSTSNTGDATVLALKGKAAAAPKLPASAYDFEFDDDDDWEMDLDLSTNKSNSSVNTSNISTSSSCNTSIASTSTKASSVASTSNSTISKPIFKSATGIANTSGPPPKSPPRAPQPFKLPTVAVKSVNAALSKRVPSSEFLPPAATQVVNIPSLPRVAPRTSKADISEETQNANIESLSARALRVPFTAKNKKDSNQTKLSGFFESSSTEERKRAAPWDEAAAGPNKVARSTSATPSEGEKEKGKGKGKGIGPLNVQQQIVLSVEQQKVLKMVVNDRQSVFFTGSAGTGKSILLREIIKSLRAKYASRGADRVAITASTGMAAANVGGTTIHSFAGIGLGQGTGEQLIDQVKKNRKAVGRWLRTEVLIVDEVSMVDGELFDKLEHIARRFRKKPDKPFGGIQLIMTGDFFQLPPVTKTGMVKFAFEAKAWKECIQATVNLNKVFRQKDTEFIDMLNEMRFGRLSQDSIVKFGKLKRLPKYTDGIEPTELFPLREQVDSANRQRLAALEGEEVVYRSHDDGEETGDRLRKTLDNVMAPPTLVLKLGAQVMLLKNMENGLVNGSVGKVIAFKTKGEMLDEEEGADEDFDVALAKTKAKMRSEYSREPSAAPSANGNEDGEDKKGPVKKAKNTAYEEKCPVVEWKQPGGGTLTMRMSREEFVVEDVGNKVKARRRQFPMICAWAMSIHKSQGQTLDRVKCDLGRIFEKGQAYVALSRATSLDGLQVLNFNPSKVLAHPKVVEWTKTLTTLN